MLGDLVHDVRQLSYQYTHGSVTKYNEEYSGKLLHPGARQDVYVEQKLGSVVEVEPVALEVAVVDNRGVWDDIHRWVPYFRLKVDIVRATADPMDNKHEIDPEE